jgi:DNA-binding beta-propeller fold protein YncE
MIAIISTASDAVTATIKLATGNPASMDTCGGYLYVSCTGLWNDTTDGGIEKINLGTGMSEGIVVAEKVFGGDITNIVIVNPHKAYVVVNKMVGDLFSTTVAECDPGKGTITGTIDYVTSASGGMAYDGTHLFIGDRDKDHPGVYVVDPTDNHKVAGPISTGALPPYAMAVLRIEK